MRKDMLSRRHNSSSASEKRPSEKKTSPNLLMTGAAIVSGGLMFVGSASADEILFESFENGTSIFGSVRTYQYSQGYTSQAIPPNAGEVYYTGDLNVAQTTRSATVGITGNDGVSAATVDAGLGVFDFSAWFSTFRSQNDWSTLTLQFQDENGVNVGSPFVIGGFDFVNQLGFGIGVGGTEPIERDWGQATTNGAIPVSARQAELTLFTQRLLGNAADGYTDNISLSVNAIPEPGSSLALAAAGVLAGLLRVRRREDI